MSRSYYLKAAGEESLTFYFCVMYLLTRPFGAQEVSFQATTRVCHNDSRPRWSNYAYRAQKIMYLKVE